MPRSTTHRPATAPRGINPSAHSANGFVEDVLIQDLRVGHRVSKDFMVSVGPDDLFILGHFNQLRIVRAGVTVADHVISVRQQLQRGNPGQGDIG